MTDVHTSEQPTDEIPAIPTTRGCPFHPPAGYEEIRQSDAPVKVALPSERTAWLLTKHEHVREALASPHVSSDRKHDNFPFLVPVTPESRKQFEDFKPALVGVDPPLHTEQRRAVITEFTVKRIKALAPRIQQIVDDAVDDLLAKGGNGEPVDLVETVSLPVPSMVICELLGVPYSDHGFFQERTKTFISFNRTPEERSRALRELGDYFRDLVAAKEKEPTDDLLGRQIAAGRADGTYVAEDLVALARILLVAGHETTANMISLGVVSLLENPDQLAALKADPERLLPSTVEEMLRVFAIADMVTARVATADIEIGGVLIREGEGIVASGLAANWDPAAFPEPERVDVARGARHHVSFGYGIHQCLGQNLARVELEMVYGTLFRRVPGLRLAVPADRLPFKHDAAIYGIHEVPVTW